jgi:DNA-binding GntR family transcriptional regulator
METALRAATDQANLSDSVYEQLVELIVSGDIADGEPVGALGVSKRLGVSRSPAHNAILRLEADGLVRFGSDRQARVIAVTRERVFEVYEMRKILEAAAADRAAGRMTLAETQPLRARLRELAAAEASALGGAPANAVARTRGAAGDGSAHGAKAAHGEKPAAGDGSAPSATASDAVAQTRGAAEDAAAPGGTAVPSGTAARRPPAASNTATPNPRLTLWAEIDEAFHTAIADASGLPSLARDIARYRLVHRAMNRSFMPHDKLDHAVAEHLAILDAIEARDPQAARERMVGHLESWQRHFIERAAAGDNGS